MHAVVHFLGQGLPCAALRLAEHGHGAAELEGARGGGRGTGGEAQRGGERGGRGGAEAVTTREEACGVEGREAAAGQAHGKALVEQVLTQALRRARGRGLRKQGGGARGGGNEGPREKEARDGQAGRCERRTCANCLCGEWDKQGYLEVCVGGGGTDVGERPMPLRPCTIAHHTVTRRERNTVSLRFSL